MARPAVLTRQQEAFARAFATNGGNAADAARMAGYRHAGMAGHRLLAVDHVLAAVVAAARDAGAHGLAALERLQARTKSDRIRLRADLLAAAPAIDAGRHARAERDAVLRVARAARPGLVGPCFRSLVPLRSSATGGEPAISNPNGSGSLVRFPTEKGNPHG